METLLVIVLIFGIFIGLAVLWDFYNDFIKKR